MICMCLEVSNKLLCEIFTLQTTGRGGRGSDAVRGLLAIGGTTGLLLPEATGSFY